VAFKHNDSCHQKAADDEPIFTLRAKDLCAPGTVVDWINRVREAGCTNEDKIAEAYACVNAMKEWQRKNGCKVPD
jgi:hypothetical protein